MARIWLLVAMVGALSLGGVGTSVSRTTSVSLSIPALSVLALPGRNLVGQELLLVFSPEDLGAEALLVPLEVKSNVSWAVTARVLDEDRAELRVAVAGGPEVAVTTEEVPLLAGRAGKHEVLLRIKFGNPSVRGFRLVLRIGGLGPKGP
ncbi:MAG: hypothetical protein N2507_03465 [Candidatus Bipolaricaulota bacterium]|nr:hypothetical protein [Candidatus Bipolaricaulota bacterium]